MSSLVKTKGKYKVECVYRKFLSELGPFYCEKGIDECCDNCPEKESGVVHYTITSIKVK